MGGHIIEQTATYKYLGVLIDENLNWVPQIDFMCKKLASVCGLLSKVRHYLNRNSLMLIYNSLIESRLRYGILSWSTAIGKHINRLKVLQNKALRFIHFASIDTSMLPIYAHYKVLPLSKLILLHQVTYMYCFENNLLPKVFDSYCVRPSHSYNTRFSTNNFLIPKFGSSYKEKSIKTIGPKVWIDVPSDVKKLPFKKTFSKHMKNFYVESLPKEFSKNKHIIKVEPPNDTNLAGVEQIFMDATLDKELFGFNISSIN